MPNILLRILLVSTLISLLGSGCDFVPQRQSNSPEPQIVSPKKALSLAKSLPSYTNFGYTGLCFFEGKLYASSNIGLLEYDSGRLSRLYKWANDEVVEQISFDKANHSIWAFHPVRNKLIRFDGNNWSFVDLPKIEDDYTRGDVLHGFQGFSTDSDFWLQGAQHAWRWNANDTSWIEEPTPVKDCYVTAEPTKKDIGCYKSHAPVKDKMLVIMHSEYIGDFNLDPSLDKSPKPPSDKVYFQQNGEWQEVPNKSAVDFITKDVVVGKDVAFIKTIYGRLFRVTTSEITPIETLGEVETMTTTSTGNLLVSFGSNGIYEYDNGWQKRFSSPYSQNEFKHFTYLAENNGQIAFAITSQRDNKAFFDKYPGQTMLWVSVGNELKAVPFEK